MQICPSLRLPIPHAENSSVALWCLDNQVQAPLYEESTTTGPLALIISARMAMGQSISLQELLSLLDNSPFTLSSPGCLLTSSKLSFMVPPLGSLHHLLKTITVCWGFHTKFNNLLTCLTASEIPLAGIVF